MTNTFVLQCSTAYKATRGKVMQCNANSSTQDTYANFITLQAVHDHQCLLIAVHCIALDHITLYYIQPYLFPHMQTRTDPYTNIDYAHLSTHAPTHPNIQVSTMQYVRIRYCAIQYCELKIAIRMHCKTLVQ